MQVNVNIFQTSDSPPLPTTTTTTTTLTGEMLVYFIPAVTELLQSQGFQSMCGGCHSTTLRGSPSS